MDAREVGQIAGAVFDAKKYELRTHVFVRVESYDADTNTVTVQQVRKAIRFTDASNVETVELPPLTEVLVRQVGSGKLWLTVAPAAGTYGYLHVSDRDVDTWKLAGGVGEPTDTRCMELRDAVFEPSLLHLADEGDAGLMAEPVKTDRISLRTRTGLTEISVLDDESVTVNVNDGKATLTIDLSGNVSLETEGDISAESTGGDVTVTADGDATVTAGGNVSTDATETALQTGTDWAVQYTALKSAFDTLKTDLNNLITAYNAHIHITTATIGVGGPGVIAPTTSAGTPSAADMSSSKITDVRVP